MGTNRTSEYGASFPSSAVSIYDHGTTKKAPVGYIKMYFNDAREFIYVLNGGAAVQAGRLVSAPTIVANHRKLAVASASTKGATKITLTMGATGVTKGDYAGGYLHFVSGTGAGQCPLKIDSHPTAAAVASCVFKVKDGLHEDIDTTTRVTLRVHPCEGVQISPIDGADTPIGILIVDLAADEYGWAVRRGPASALSDQAWSPGDALTIGSGTQGGLMKKAAAGDPEVAVGDDTAAIGDVAPVWMKC